MQNPAESTTTTCSQGHPPPPFPLPSAVAIPWRSNAVCRDERCRGSVPTALWCIPILQEQVVSFFEVNPPEKKLLFVESFSNKPFLLCCISKYFSISTLKGISYLYLEQSFKAQALLLCLYTSSFSSARSPRVWLTAERGAGGILTRSQHLSVLQVQHPDSCTLTAAEGRGIAEV